MKSFKIFNYFLIGINFSLIIWLITLFFLEKTPTYYIPQKDFHYFVRINLTPLFFNTSSNKNNNKITNVYTLKNMKLKAVYLNNNNSFIIISINNKNKFLNLNETINGYKLIKITPNSAIFEKNNKNYKISFDKIKSFATSNQDNIYIPKIIFQKYKNNLSLIWKNIGIIKYKNGYKITYVRKNSIFDKIGLKRGDIILAVNGKKLNSDKDAWEIYNNIDKYNYYEIKIKRNNQIKVLNYEVN